MNVWLRLNFIFLKWCSFCFHGSDSVFVFWFCVTKNKIRWKNAFEMFMSYARHFNCTWAKLNWACHDFRFSLFISEQKPASTVRFFDRNEYYSLHGEDAHLAAKIIFKSTAQIKTMAPDGERGVDYVCMSKGNFEILLRELLLVKNYRVEVYTKKGLGDWTLEFKGSPGNLIQFENLLFNNTEMVVGSSMISVNMKQTGQQKVLVSFFTLTSIAIAWVFFQNEKKNKSVWIFVNTFSKLLEYWCGMRWTKRANVFGYWIRWQRLLCWARGNNRIAWAKGSVVAITWWWIRAHRQIAWAQQCDGDNTEKKRIFGGKIRPGARFKQLTAICRRTTRECTRFARIKNEPGHVVAECSHQVSRFNVGQLQFGPLQNCIAEFEPICALGCRCRVCVELASKTRHSHQFTSLQMAEHFGRVGSVSELKHKKMSNFQGTNKWFRIIVVDRCQTPQGHRLMAQWVKVSFILWFFLRSSKDIFRQLMSISIALQQPLRNEELIKDRHNIVECFVDASTARSELYEEHLKRMPDILVLNRFFFFHFWSAAYFLRKKRNWWKYLIFL